MYKITNAVNPVIFTVKSESSDSDSTIFVHMGACHGTHSKSHPSDNVTSRSGTGNFVLYF